MGMIIQKYDFIHNEDLLYLRPIIFCCNDKEVYSQAVSINVLLSKLLVECKPERRTMKLELYFNQVLSQFSDDVVIKDFDVLFNPKYQIDVLKILISAYRRKRFHVIWPGYYEDGKLYYSENGFADYKVYDVNDYDITCVI